LFIKRFSWSLTLGLSRISELDLGNCGLKEVSCFNQTDFRSLKKLTFDNNLLTNIDPLRFLGGVRYLSLNNNRIERLLTDEALARREGSSRKYIFPFLEDLFLGYNQISHIQDLALNRIPQLKVLHLQGNKIQKVSVRPVCGLFKM
jgi:Leucine-rich repeat (LRR) protein